MQIMSSRITPKSANIDNSAPSKPEQSQLPEQPNDQFKDLVVKGAYASGGALAGVGLGVVTGGVLSTLTGTPALTTVGGVMGALGGAGTAFAVADSENKAETLRQVGLGWTGASIGAAAGQYIAGGMLQHVAQAAGLHSIAAAAPFVGTATGALLGAYTPMSNSSGQVPEILIKATAVSTGGAVGLFLGTAGKAWAMSNPAMAHMGTIAPALGSLTGAAIGLAASLDGENKLVGKAASGLAGSAFYYGVGSVAGAIAHAAGGSSLYTHAFPAIGAIAGGLLAQDVEHMFNLSDPGPAEKIASRAGATLLGGMAGTMVGDVAGHILTGITGQDIYSNIGFAVGAANGGLMGLTAKGVDTKDAIPASIITTFGVGLGALGGAGLTYLTGNPLYNQVGGIVGGVNGALGAMEFMEIGSRKALPTALSGTVGLGLGAVAGTALSAVTGHSIYENAGAASGLVSGVLLGLDKSGAVDTKGAAETISGAVAGVGVGALLGASLNALTGQEIWGLALPALGAAAGGLGVLAATLTKEDGGQ